MGCCMRKREIAVTHANRLLVGWLSPFLNINSAASTLKQSITTNVSFTFDAGFKFHSL